MVIKTARLLDAYKTLSLFAEKMYRLQFNGVKLCNVVACILRIKCPLSLSVSYVCFDIERASTLKEPNNGVQTYPD